MALLSLVEVFDRFSIPECVVGWIEKDKSWNCDS